MVWGMRANINTALTLSSEQNFSLYVDVFSSPDYLPDSWDPAGCPPQWAQDWAPSSSDWRVETASPPSLHRTSRCPAVPGTIHKCHFFFYRESQKKVYCDTGLDLSQSQAFSTESNQSQTSIHVNIMVPGVTGNFLLGIPVLNINIKYK